MCFEKEDDAEKLRMAESFEVRGHKVYVIRDKVMLRLSLSIPNKCIFLWTVASCRPVLNIL